MPEPAEDRCPPPAARLGVAVFTVYGLIDKARLAAEITVPTDRPGQRRRVRARRVPTDEYIEGAHGKPGELGHLHRNWTWERYGSKPGDLRTCIRLPARRHEGG